MSQPFVLLLRREALGLYRTRNRHLPGWLPEFQKAVDLHSHLADCWIRMHALMEHGLSPHVVDAIQRRPEAVAWQDQLLLVESELDVLHAPSELLVQLLKLILLEAASQLVQKPCHRNRSGPHDPEPRGPSGLTDRHKIVQHIPPVDQLEQLLQVRKDVVLPFELVVNFVLVVVMILIYAAGLDLICHIALANLGAAQCNTTTLRSKALLGAATIAAHAADDHMAFQMPQLRRVQQGLAPRVEQLDRGWQTEVFHEKAVQSVHSEGRLDVERLRLLGIPPLAHDGARIFAVHWRKRGVGSPRCLPIRHEIGRREQVVGVA
mmetsp:Transcript_49545/g.106009  ORF Transcript_49545/g.106009 Transcript_49545/m.106009 type:complete len:320 (-) Transcript_49545:703-1662(-)